MDKKITWEKPEVEDLGEAKDLIKNVFKVGTGDTEPGMNTILAPSWVFLVKQGAEKISE